MTKRKNKGKGVRAKKPRSRIVKVAKKAKRVPNPVQRVRDPDYGRTFVSDSVPPHSQSESADAEGGTPGAAPSIQEVAMELGSEPEPEPERRPCPSCERYNVSSHMERDEFGWGVAPDTVVLTADVEVFECADCKERWTGEQAEKARQAAVDAHLAALGPNAPDTVYS